MFHGLLAADLGILDRYFSLHGSGDTQHWRIELTPRSVELGKFIKALQLTGGQEYRDYPGRGTQQRHHPHSFAECGNRRQPERGRTGADQRTMKLGLRQRALLWSAVAFAAVAVCIYFAVQGIPLQTNLLALLPATERDPVAEEAVVTLNNAIGNRVVFLVSYPESAMAGEVATRFADSLKKSGAFSRVIVSSTARPGHAPRPLWPAPFRPAH